MHLQPREAMKHDGALFDLVARRFRSLAAEMGCVLMCLSTALVCQRSWADTFILPTEKDFGFYVQLDWRGAAALAETRISTGERGQSLESKSLRLDPGDAQMRAMLSSIFTDLEQATKQAECHALVLMVICRNTADLMIRSRASGLAGSDVFRSESGYIWCLDGLAGSGACKDTKPVESARKDSK
jgi:hypothetical protein